MLFLHIASSFLLLTMLALSFFSLSFRTQQFFRYTLPIATATSSVSGLWLIAASGTSLSVSCLRGGLLLVLIGFVWQRRKVYASV